MPVMSTLIQFGGRLRQIRACLSGRNFEPGTVILRFSPTLTKCTTVTASSLLRHRDSESRVRQPVARASEPEWQGPSFKFSPRLAVPRGHVEVLHKLTGRLLGMVPLRVHSDGLPDSEPPASRRATQ
eukprot:147600-Rhodomonas_salina.3